MSASSDPVIIVQRAYICALCGTGRDDLLRKVLGLPPRPRDPDELVPRRTDPDPPSAASGPLSAPPEVFREVAKTADHAGKHPFHHAAMVGDNDVLDTLLEIGESINVRTEDEERSTALHIAALNGEVSTVTFLARRGADPTIESASGRSALSCAREMGCEGAGPVLHLAATRLREPEVVALPEAVPAPGMHAEPLVLRFSHPHPEAKIFATCVPNLPVWLAPKAVAPGEVALVLTREAAAYGELHDLSSVAWAEIGDDVDGLRRSLARAGVAGYRDVGEEWEGGLADRLLSGSAIKVAGEGASTSALLVAATEALRRRVGWERDKAATVRDSKTEGRLLAPPPPPATLLRTHGDGEVEAWDAGDLVGAGEGGVPAPHIVRDPRELPHEAKPSAADAFAGEWIDDAAFLRGRPVFVRAAAQLPNGQWSHTATFEYRLLSPLEQFFEALPFELRRHRGRLLAFGLTDLHRLTRESRRRLRRAFARIGIPKEDATAIIRALRARAHATADSSDEEADAPEPGHVARASQAAVARTEDSATQKI